MHRFGRIFVRENPTSSGCLWAGEAFEWWRVVALRHEERALIEEFYRSFSGKEFGIERIRGNLEGGALVISMG